MCGRNEGSRSLPRPIEMRHETLNWLRYNRFRNNVSMGNRAPDEGHEHSLQARAREMQELAEALAVNDTILSTHPDDLAAQIRRGRCLRALGRIEDAQTVFDVLLGTHPRDSVVRSQHDKTLRLAKARRRAEQLMSRGPAELFDALEQAKRSEREVDFQIEGRRLLARHDGTVEAACALGAAQRRARDRDGALNTYRWAANQGKSGRGRAMASVGLAGVLRDLRRLNDAEQLLRDVLATDTRNTFASLGLAGVLMDRIEYQGQRDLGSEVKRMLDALYARGARDEPVKLAYQRLKSLM
jgi:tetratricopeptide (TPR) repeat protein